MSRPSVICIVLYCTVFRTGPAWHGVRRGRMCSCSSTCRAASLARRRARALRHASCSLRVRAGSSLSLPSLGSAPGVSAAPPVARRSVRGRGGSSLSLPPLGLAPGLGAAPLGAQSRCEGNEGIHNMGAPLPAQGAALSAWYAPIGYAGWGSWLREHRPEKEEPCQVAARLASRRSGSGSAVLTAPLAA